jgi:hypothetical protein
MILTLRGFMTSVLATLLLAPLPAPRAQEPPDTKYEESKVPPYTLPDPLVCFDGRRVTNLTLWRETRRPEILCTFATNVYGRTPQVATQLRFETTETDAQALAGLATRKQVTIRLFAQADTPWIDLLLYLPNHVAKPV